MTKNWTEHKNGRKSIVVATSTHSCELLTYDLLEALCFTNLRYSLFY